MNRDTAGGDERDEMRNGKNKFLKRKPSVTMRDGTNNDKDG